MVVNDPIKAKKKLAKKVVEVFIREGRILNPTEWSELAKKPCNGVTMRRHLGSWNRMLARVQMTYPKLWDKIGSKEEYVSDTKQSSVLVAAQANIKNRSPAISIIKDKLAEIKALGNKNE